MQNKLKILVLSAVMGFFTFNWTLADLADPVEHISPKTSKFVIHSGLITSYEVTAVQIPTDFELHGVAKEEGIKLHIGIWTKATLLILAIILLNYYWEWIHLPRFFKKHLSKK